MRPLVPELGDPFNDYYGLKLFKVILTWPLEAVPIPRLQCLFYDVHTNSASHERFVREQNFLNKNVVLQLEFCQSTLLFENCLFFRYERIWNIDTFPTFFKNKNVYLFWTLKGCSDDIGNLIDFPSKNL